MRRVLISVLAALAVAAPVHQGMRAVLAASSQQARALFRWSIPQKGHVGSWRAQGGVLSYEGASAGVALPRFTVPAHTNFAVQAMIRTTGPGTVSASLNGFGLLVRGMRADPHTMVGGGSFFDADFAPNHEDNMPELYWNGQTIGAAAFDPKKAWHRYQLMVQGDQYTVSIDGKVMVSYRVPEYSYPTTVGVFSWYYQVQLKQFEVDAIGPSSSQMQADPVPRDANLTVGDLPTTGFYDPYLHHWYTLPEVERENQDAAKVFNIDPALLASPGRSISYGVDFFARSRELSDVYSAIIPFDSAADAQANLTAKRAVEHLEVTRLPGVSNSHDLSVTGVGNAGWGVQTDYDAGSGVFGRLTIVDFVRGRYSVFLRIASDPSSDQAPDAAKTAAIAIELAHTIDARLPHG
jgi:hypothetical protein